MHRILGISVLLTTSLTFLIVINLPSSAALKPYGEACNKRKDCDTSSGLTCHKHVCLCSRPESTVYSESVKGCLVRIGRICDDSGKTGRDVDFNATIDHESATTVQPTSVGTTCIENADCKKLRARYWCQCKEGYVANAEGTECKAMSKYGEFCDEDADQCDRSSGLDCIDQNCVCAFPDHQFFDQYEGRCISFAGGNCSVPKMSHCVQNAECTSAQVRMGYTTEKGVKKIHTKTITQCLCKSGYSQTTNGFCFGSSGTVCNSKLPCNQENFLFCVDGKCKCRNPLHEIVDENSGACVALVGTTCEPRRGPKCVENSECKDERCKCSEGYTATPNKTCLLDYREPCLPNQCNGYRGMSCIKGRCDCFDSYLLYDVTTKACVGVSSSSDD